MYPQNFAKFTSRFREYLGHCAARSPGDGEFNQWAMELFALQFAHNLPYRRFCEARKITPGTVGSWEDVPFVPTSAFKEFDFSCLLPEDRSLVFYSSGTTEHRPSRHFHNLNSLKIYEESLWAWFVRHLLPEQGLRVKLMCLTPPPDQAPHSSLVHMFKTVSVRLEEATVFLGMAGSEGWELEREAGGALQRVCEGAAAVLLMGTAFNFVQLLDMLEKGKLTVRLPPGSRILETGGYKGRTRSLPKRQLHAALAQSLGALQPYIISEYGMSELSSQAYDGIAGAAHEPRRFRFAPWARAQVISPETGRPAGTGEVGLLRVMDLANVYSVAAVQTEDLARTCEDGFELLGRAARAEPRGCSLLSMESN